MFEHNRSFTGLLKEKHILLLQNGVDTTIFFPRNVKVTGDRLKFLFVARLEECKGILILLEAWSLIQDKSRMELHIVGDGTFGPLLEERSRYSQNIFYHGAIESDELARVYRDADIFVYPSECDTFGNVVIEALASGLYVITSQYLKGIFDNFESMGFLEYVPRDPKTIAERMIAIESDPKFMNIDRHSLFDHVKNNYDWSAISRKLFSSLQNLMKEN